jgi:uncharacterized delta-60 repeat protein
MRTEIRRLLWIVTVLLALVVSVRVSGLLPANFPAAGGESSAVTKDEEIAPVAASRPPLSAAGQPAAPVALSVAPAVQSKQTPPELSSASRAVPRGQPDKKAATAVPEPAPKADYQGLDSGLPRNFVLALDEVWVSDGRGGGSLEKVFAADRRELDGLLAALSRSRGAQTHAVMYEAGRPRDQWSRRLVLPSVLVQSSGAAQTAALAKVAGAGSLERPAYAPGFALLKTDTGLAALRAAEALRAAGASGVEVQLAAWKAKRAMPNDALIGQQWHLKYNGQAGALAGCDINVENAWIYPGNTDGVRGRGIRIGIVDDGVQTSHPDLAANIDTAPTHYDWNDNDTNPNPLATDPHGTACAGDAAAVGNNGLGVSGSAPQAILVGLRLLGGAYGDAQEAAAFAHRQDIIEIKSNSWGPIDDGARLEGPGTLAAAALQDAIANGRGGKGTIFLWACGNGYENLDDSNYDGYANSIYTIAVAASDSQLYAAWYSEAGANLHVCSPSNGEFLGKTTTDLTGTDGYETGDYTSDFGGTSSATPTAAGVVALMLEANPDLGWRDVQEILMKSAKKIRPAVTGWSVTAAGINHHHDFGAGLIDASAAVALARTWTNLDPAVVREVSQTGINLPIPDNNPTGVVRQFVIAPGDNVRIEHVTLRLLARHTYRGDLVVTLTSPSGITSRLAEAHDDPGDNYDWTFSSVRHWGDQAAGVWTVRVSDQLAQDTGILDGLILRVHGTPIAPVNPPPSVSLTSPVDGSVVAPGGTVALAAAASDLDIDGNASPVDRVEFLAQREGEPAPFVVHTAVAAPYQFSWVPEPGVYSLRARAADAEGLTAESAPVRLEVRYPLAGEVRESFIPPAADGAVNNLASDASGRIYIGGQFTKLNGNAAPRLARLRTNGSVDPSFFVGAGPDGSVRALHYSAEPGVNGLYVGGDFANFGGVARRALVRLNIGRPGLVDGSVDTTFNPVIEGPNASTPPYVRAIAMQSDGKIIAAGSFSRVNGSARSNVARFHPDGSLDSSFAPEPNGPVHCLALQPDGKIVLGGAFARVSDVECSRIARLHRDGRVDGSFSTGTGVTAGFDGPVNALAVTLDGHIIAGGQFTRYNGRPHYNNLAKLASDGTVDGKFNFSPGLDNAVYDLHLRPGGEILASGAFTSAANSALELSSVPFGRVLQFDRTQQGLPDPKFAAGTGANGSVLDSITTRDGEILLAGAFTSFNGTPRARLVALSGYDQSAPLVISQPFFSVDAGLDFAHAFSATGRGEYFDYTVNWVNRPDDMTSPLPRGLRLSQGRLAGIPLDAGRYEFEVVATGPGAATSEATRFVLTVNEAVVPYAQWKRVWFDPAAQADAAASGPAAVRNAAGLSNFMVYALDGGDPHAPDASIAPQVLREKIGPRYFLTLRAPKYARAAADYRVEYSRDLHGAWATEENGGVVSLIDSPAEIKARAAVSTDLETKQFLRLKILSP